MNYLFTTRGKENLSCLVLCHLATRLQNFNVCYLCNGNNTVLVSDI